MVYWGVCGCEVRGWGGRERERKGYRAICWQKYAHFLHQATSCLWISRISTEAGAATGLLLTSIHAVPYDLCFLSSFLAFSGFFSLSFVSLSTSSCIPSCFALTWPDLSVFLPTYLYMYFSHLFIYRDLFFFLFLIRDVPRYIFSLLSCAYTCLVRLCVAVLTYLTPCPRLVLLSCPLAFSFTSCPSVSLSVSRCHPHY